MNDRSRGSNTERSQLIPGRSECIRVIAALFVPGRSCDSIETTDERGAARPQPKNLTAVSHMRRTRKHMKMLPGSARILRALLIAKP